MTLASPDQVMSEGGTLCVSDLFLVMSIGAYEPKLMGRQSFLYNTNHHWV